VLFYVLQNPDCPIHSGPYANLTVERLKKTRDYIEDVIQPLANARMDRQDAGQVADEVSNAARLLRHACSLAIARLQTPDGRIANILPDVRKELAVDLARIISEYKRLWLLRNREGGLADSAARMERLLELYQD